MRPWRGIVVCQIADAHSDILAHVDKGYDKLLANARLVTEAELVLAEFLDAECIDK